MRRRREKVLINVYDLMPHNDYLYVLYMASRGALMITRSACARHFAGLGAYHTGLEIHSREYSFGGHEFSSSGVFICETKTAPGARFREVISVV